MNAEVYSGRAAMKFFGIDTSGFCIGYILERLIPFWGRCCSSTVELALLAGSISILRRRTQAGNGSFLQDGKVSISNLQKNRANGTVLFINAFIAGAVIVKRNTG